MNVMNLTKRPLGILPEDSQQMVNLLLINALDQAGAEHDKAEYWETEHYKSKKFIEKLSKYAEVKINSRGTAFINFDYIDQKYDEEMFDYIIKYFDLGAKLIEAEADFEKEENETNN